MTLSTDNVPFAMLNLDSVQCCPYDAVMDSIEVRRVWLRCGGSLSQAARELGTAKQIVQYHVRKANREAPLTFHAGNPDDQMAMMAYHRSALSRVGIAPD